MHFYNNQRRHSVIGNAQPDRLRTITQRGHTSRITPLSTFRGNLTVLDDDSGQDTEWAALRQCTPATNPHHPRRTKSITSLLDHSALGHTMATSATASAVKSHATRSLSFLATVVALGAVFVY